MVNWHKLFEDRERLFWTLHVGGWAGFALVYYIGSFLHDMRTVWIFVIFLNAIAGCLISIPLRYVYQKVAKLQPWQMLLSVLVSCFVVSLLWQVMKNVHFWEIYKHGYRPEDWYYYLNGSLNSFFILMCWTGLYFGIKNYQLLQKEKQNALKSNAMAHQAHIKMLRYQLNPHFLFNTLNAISTLILVKENKTAEEMVSRLSDFLRYSLDKDPIKKVPLEQEIQALSLYLDIEKVRFDERLDVQWKVDEDTSKALVPSLILQPLVENAIKYAISKMEQGGEICIATRLFGRDLLLEVADNGPGADIVNGQLHRTNGVGLTNIQERLHSLYGQDYSFVVSHNDPTGIKVSIRIPYELVDNG
ncbi:sensor histidine kinase [Planctobacterium marinum]|uniref:sensor histidine kinase n=1 Tax=Planctobacterium marinum TaxID=1631968 RepID=UPI001E2FC2F8|nr:histidine kinase [Planctobacterium marinum]MCC2604238.1 histidine kinase [Planctobacterium marinum]